MGSPNLRVSAGFLSHAVHGLRQPFSREPDFAVTRANYDFAGSRVRRLRSDCGIPLGSLFPVSTSECIS